ncbi:hypothetical protein PBI_244_98 [Mycobacterium phage 244]|uniref:Uncharacterized protein n=1 Tax=Mycobacterium phage 244 TaxID=2902792 RepID=Q1A0X3_9CAUD|nr:gp98 [Mycobacterium phage 244]ABD58073.1 hypothetical protein PBI_244_98 [Mycobacterium phage 244]
MPSIEEINQAAQVLEDLVEEGAHRELDHDTHFMATVANLRTLAYQRTPQTLKVYRRDGRNGYTIYAEKRDGTYVATYVTDGLPGGSSSFQNISSSTVEAHLKLGELELLYG